MEENNKDIVGSGQQETVLFQDACQIIELAQESAYRQVNETLIKRNWLLGMRIQHEVLKDRKDLEKDFKWLICTTSLLSTITILTFSTQ